MSTISRAWWSAITDRMPLVYVFMSGVGFSIQALIIKLLAEAHFRGSFYCVFMRGLCQMSIASWFIYKLHREENDITATTTTTTTTYNNNYNNSSSASNSNNSTDAVPTTSTTKLFGNTTFVRVMLFLRASIGFCSIACSFLAAEYISIGDSTVLIMLSPMVASVASYFLLGEIWRLPEFLAMILSITGAILVAKPSFIFGHTHHTYASSQGADGESPSGGSTSMDSPNASKLGVMFGLSAAVFAGFAFICVRVLGTSAKMPWANVCFSQALGQLVFAPPLLYIFGQSFSEIFHLTLWEGFLIFMGGFIGAWSQISMTLGMQREKSATASAMRMSDVLFGFIWQILFTPDPINFLSILGALLVTGSIMVVVIFKPPSTPAVPQTTAKIELVPMDSSAHSMLHKFPEEEDYEIDKSDHETIELHRRTTESRFGLGSSISGHSGYLQVTVAEDTDSPMHRTLDVDMAIARISSTDGDQNNETTQVYSFSHEEYIRKETEGIQVDRVGTMDVEEC